MENEDMIRDQMKDTRTAMTEKLEELEHKVVATVENATSAVANTVESVKDSVKETTSAVTETVEQVQETVEETAHSVTDTLQGGAAAVRDFFSIRKNPWIGIGASVLAGFVVGKMVIPARPRRIDPIQGLSSTGGHTTTSAPPAAAVYAPTPPTPAPPPPVPPPAAPPRHAVSKNGGHRERAEKAPLSQRGWLEGIADQVSPELNKFKAMALGMLLDASRDFVVQGVPPQWKEQVQGVFHGLASKLHATPESVEEDAHATREHEGEGRGHRSDSERSGHRHGKRSRFDR